MKEEKRFKWWEQEYVWHSVIFCVLFFGGLWQLFINRYVGLVLISSSFPSMILMVYTMGRDFEVSNKK